MSIFKRQFHIRRSLRLQELKFYYKHVHNNLPQYLQQMPLIPNNEIHNHDTRRHNEIHIYATQHAFAKRCIRYNIPKTVNAASAIIKEKVATHSLHGFTTYIKIHYLQNNNIQCTLPNCYVFSKMFIRMLLMLSRSILRYFTSVIKRLVPMFSQMRLPPHSVVR